MSSHTSRHGYRLVLSVMLSFVVLAVLTSTPVISSNESGEASSIPEVLIARLRINWLNSTFRPEIAQFAPAAPSDFPAKIFARIDDCDRSGDGTSGHHMLDAMRC